MAGQINCNEIHQVATELQMKFQNCSVLNANDLDCLVDLITSIGDCITEGNYDQNNKIITVNIDNDFNLSIEQKVNNSPLFTVNEDEIFLFSTQEYYNNTLNLINKIYILKPGKGVYGNGSMVSLTNDNFICIEDDSYINILNELIEDLIIPDSINITGTFIQLIANNNVISQVDMSSAILECMQNNPDIICGIIDNNCGPDPENIPPTVDAGLNQTIELPISSTTITAIGNDVDGTIVSYQWVKISGGNVTITNPNSASTTLTDLVFGTYVFEVTVTDNDGAIATDAVIITVTNVVYYNMQISQNFTKNDCSANEIGSVVIYTVPANTYTSIVSQADADQQAFDDITLNGQVYANANGTCTLITQEKPVIVTTSSDNCESLWDVMVTVPAGQTRTVTISNSGLATFIGFSGTETISATKTYTLTLDAAVTIGTQDSSSIVISIMGQGSLTLTRTHDFTGATC